MKLRIVVFVLLMALFTFCSPAARANKSHTFGGGPGGDEPAVYVYVYDPSNVLVWALGTDQDSQAPIAGSTGFVRLSFSEDKSSYTVTFYTGPSFMQRIAFETDTINFASNGDLNDDPGDYVWPYPVIVNAPSLPYDWFCSTGDFGSNITCLDNAGVGVGFHDERDIWENGTVHGDGLIHDYAISYSVGLSGVQSNIAPSFGGKDSRATCIDNLGDIAAVENDQDPVAQRGVLLPAGGIAVILDPSNPFNPVAVNSQHTVIGTGGVGGNHACVYFNGVFTDLQAAHVFPAGTLSSNATGVNDGNLVCGSYTDANSTPHAYLWSPGMASVTTLSQPTPYVDTTAAALNQAGIVVGSAYDGTRHHAVLWDAAGVLHDLGTLNQGDDYAVGINNLGQVVGNEATNSWLWDSYQGIRSISSVNPVSVDVVSGINDIGDLLGTGLSPLPEGVGGLIMASSLFSDPSFNAVPVGPTGVSNSYQYNPTGSPWTFTGKSGIGADGSLFNQHGFPGAPSGTQFAFLESTDTQGGQISQAITIPANGGYAVTFFAMQRDQAGRDNTGAQPFRVAIDGQSTDPIIPPVGSWNASSSRTLYSQAYETDPFELTAGTHTLTFTSDAAPAGTDNTALINGVNISLVRSAVAVAAPASQTAGVPFPVTGTVYDAFGNRVVNTPVTLRLSGPGTLTIGATSATTDANGAFTFSGLTIDTTGPGYSFTVTAPQVGVKTFATTNMFTVNPPPPTITSISPPSGPVGTLVTLTGTNFMGVTRVRFHNASATTYTVNSPTQLTVAVPVGAGTGTITVNEPNETVVSSQTFTVSASPKPVLASFTPTSGGIDTLVTLTGTGFTGANAVKFGGIAASFTVTSDTQIVAAVPPAVVTGTITVTTPGGTATGAQTFTVLSQPTITSISPTSGPIGTLVTLTGTNFQQITRVRFHNASALTYTVNGAGTQIVVTVPSGAGTGTITINETGITLTSSQTFTVTPSPAPTITALAPASGPVGTLVTITGTNFNGVTQVRFHNASAATYFVTGGGTQLSVPVPSGAGSGTITVTAAGGSVTSAQTFTVVSVAVQSLTFTPNPASAGSTVTGYVLLNGPAPARGASVGISYNGSLVTTVSIGAGGQLGTFSVQAGASASSSSYLASSGSSGVYGTLVVN